jgi:metal-sulfur cluster biosynthetic enzyme
MVGERRPSRIEVMVSEDDVTEALSNVIDPELGLDFVELGLVYDVAIEGGTVNITFTLTTPACPIGPQVSEQMKEFVGELDGVEDVVPSMVFTPPWTPDKMSEDAKFALGY